MKENNSELDKELLCAVTRCDLGAVKAYIAQGANVDAVDNNGKIDDGIITRSNGGMEIAGQTALHKVATFGHVAIAEELLKRKANVNAVDANNETSLFKAVKAGKKKLAELLITADAKLDIVTECNSSAIRIAAENGDTDCLRLLIDHKADIDGERPRNFHDKYSRPLHLAAVNNHIDSVRILLAKGAKVDSKNCYAETPLHHAATGEIVTLLIDRGADVNAEASYSESQNIHVRYTPLHSAVLQTRESTVEALIDSGAELDTKNYRGQTALQLAVHQSHYKLRDLQSEHESIEQALAQLEQEPYFKISQILIKKTLLKNSNGEAAAYLSHISQIPENPDLYKKLYKVWDTDKEEIKMEEIIINERESCSLYPFSQEKDPDKLAVICTPAVEKRLQFPSLKEKFPLHFNHIQDNLEIGKERRKARSNFTSRLIILPKSKEGSKRAALPPELFEKIHKKLSLDDIKVLTKASMIKESKQSDSVPKVATPSIESKQPSLATSSYAGARPKHLSQSQHSEDQAKKDFSTSKTNEGVAVAIDLLKKKTSTSANVRAAAESVLTRSHVVMQPSLFAPPKQEKDESKKDKDAEKKKLEERRLKY